MANSNLLELGTRSIHFDDTTTILPNNKNENMVEIEKLLSSNHCDKANNK